MGEEGADWAGGLEAFWSHPLPSIGGASVTVGNVAAAVLFVVVAGFASRWVSRLLGARALPRAGFDEGASRAFELLAFYLMLAVVLLLGLRILGIPLTAFAVLGGALAIGVGFGSQNVVNNFISGLILLAERPIKVGDLVELGEVWGNVERIGLRSTRIRTGDNAHIIVPNSSFLENNVTNWTHRDSDVRLRLGVGVVYGSPVAVVKRLLLQAVTEHENVQPTPEPLVLFRDFGDDSLQFEIWFWVRIRNYTSRAIVESAIRERVDELFRQDGIVIAFPQRDVHLDAAGPIPVRVVEPRREGPA